MPASELSPFADSAALENRFADGLAAMLAAHPGLGAYILVLANAAYDPALWARLRGDLEQRHAELAARLSASLRAGRALTEPEDDVLVFLKLLAIGFEHIGQPEVRTAGPWRIGFNPLRALRPPRASGQRFERLARPFDAAGFHFNKPFLAKEIFWHGALAGVEARLLYNKFPFARLHGLLVPEPERGLPQYLGRAQHDWAWRVCSDAGVAGLRLGYNSAGAGASVNHLHFQSFVDDELPVERAGFRHNGGATPYPLACAYFADPDAAWERLAELHARECPYNLVYRPGGLSLIARAPQDGPALAGHTRAWGWSEMAGALTVFSREAYGETTAAGFAADLARFAE